MQGWRGCGILKAAGGNRNGHVDLANVLTASYKITRAPTNRSTPGSLLKGVKARVHDVYCKFIRGSLKWKATPKASNRWVDKDIVVYLCTGVLLGNKK